MSSLTIIWKVTMELALIKVIMKCNYYVDFKRQRQCSLVFGRCANSVTCNQSVSHCVVRTPSTSVHICTYRCIPEIQFNSTKLSYSEMSIIHWTKYHVEYFPTMGKDTKGYMYPLIIYIFALNNRKRTNRVGAAGVVKETKKNEIK